jgi:hypothetical protein
MIITFGPSTWRSDRSSSSSSQLRSETAPAKTANSRYGHRQAAKRAPASSVKSPSGVPLSASTPRTADRPEQASYKRPLPFGNRSSTETLPCAATAQAQMQGNTRVVDPLQSTSAKTDVVSLQHALFAGVPRPDPACERQRQLERFARSTIAGLRAVARIRARRA